MRGPFAKYYEPYAEYCLRSTLSAAELEAALEKECPASLWSCIRAACSIFSGKVVFYLCSNDPLTLTPALGKRNSLQGEVRIRCEGSAGGSETILHIEIAPSKRSAWFPYVYCAFALLLAIAEFCIFGLWWMLLIALAFIGFCFFVLECSRSNASDEVPHIRQEFEILLRKLEDKYPRRTTEAENETRETSARDLAVVTTVWKIGDKEI